MNIDEMNQLFDLIDHLKEYVFHALIIFGTPPIKIVKSPILERKMEKKRKKKHKKRKRKRKQLDE